MILALNNDFSYREKKTFFDNQTKRFQNPEIEFNLEKSVEFKTWLKLRQSNSENIISINENRDG